MMEDGKASDARLRAHYIKIGIIIPRGADWERELDEYEAERLSVSARRKSLRLVHSGAGRGR